MSARGDEARGRETEDGAAGEKGGEGGREARQKDMCQWCSTLCVSERDGCVKHNRTSLQCCRQALALLATGSGR